MDPAVTMGEEQGTDSAAQNGPASRDGRSTDGLHAFFNLASGDAHFRRLIESTEQPFCVAWDFLFLYCNPAFAELLGYDSPAQVCALTYRDIVPPEDVPLYVERQRRRSAGEAMQSRYEARFVRRDGRIIWAEVTSQLCSFDGQPAIVIAYHDISDRRHAEEELARSLAVLKATLESSKDGLLAVDEQGRIISYNQPFAQMWGVSAEILATRDDSLALSTVLDKLVDPLGFLSRVRELYANNEASSADRIELLDGRVFERWSHPQLLEGGVIGRVWRFRDITAALHAEQELKESQRILEETQEMGKVGSWAADFATDRIYWSRNAFRLYGLDPQADEASLDTIISRVHPQDRQRVLDTIEAGMAEGAGHDVEFRIILPDGHLRWIHTRSRVERGAQGQPLRLQGMDVDITERKAAEESLERSLSLLRAALESSEDGVVVVNLEGLVVAHNERFLSLWGMGPELMRIESRAERMRCLLSQVRDEESFMRGVENLDSSPESSSFDVIELKDGRVIERWSQPQWSGGRGVGRVWRFRDVTAQRRTEEDRAKLEAQLRQAQKMEAIGTLAGGIAHDFNNILYAISGYAEIVMQSLPEDSPLRLDQAEVLTASRRAAELVQHILTFSRQGRSEPILVLVPAIIKEVMRLLRATLPTTISLQQNIQARDGTVLADPTQLHQVLMNLCTNAGQAMQEGGGVLEVGLRHHQVEAESLEARRGLQPGDYLILSVKDSGQGIPPDVLDRIFDPFFTTKEVGVGTGLGLSTVHGIVTALGGDISVYTELGQGSIFNVYLPCAQLAASAPVSHWESLPGGSERILFVDDEDSLARLGRDMLGRLGYQVTALSSSPEALQLFEADPQAFDLLITDQTMPGLTGRALAQRVLELRPGLPIILCTGFSHVMSEEMARELGLAEYLLKPVSRAELAKAVRRALDNRGPS